MSRPSRGAWIEMIVDGFNVVENIVAPLAGRVD